MTAVLSWCLDLQVSIFDHDRLSADDLLGSTEVPVAALWGAGGVAVSGTFPLFLDGKAAGSFSCTCAVTGEGGCGHWRVHLPEYELAHDATRCRTHTHAHDLTRAHS